VLVLKKTGGYIPGIFRMTFAGIKRLEDTQQAFLE
jgi:hypothetical protein